MANLGRLVSVEGIDGSGKSTQARMLAEYLQGQGRPTLLTREPGGSAGAEDIRNLVLNGPQDRWSAESELLLFTAARRDHLEKTIRPALAQGITVLTDRFADSTRVYQGLTRGDLRGKVDALHDLMIGQEPDLTLIFDMDPEQALRRSLARAGTETRFEGFGVGFQTKVRASFLALAKEFPTRCVVIDASGTPEAVFQRSRAAVEARL